MFLCFKWSVDFISCEKFGVVGDVARATPVELAGATPCAGGSLASPEAFVMKHCHTNSSSYWIAGSAVSAYNRQFKKRYNKTVCRMSLLLPAVYSISDLDYFMTFWPPCLGLSCLCFCCCFVLHGTIVCVNRWWNKLVKSFSQTTICFSGRSWLCLSPGLHCRGDLLQRRIQPGHRWCGNFSGVFA